MIEINFSGFEGREEELSKMKRYTDPMQFPVMFYRPSVLFHTKRVYWLVNDVVDVAKEVHGDKFDAMKAKILALIHDDVEIVTGDVMRSDKIKMNGEEKAKLKEREIEAVEILSKKFPEKINGFSYKELLYDVLGKKSVEAQLVNYLDKLDGHCESLHELYAGNKFHVLPSLGYVRWLGELREKDHALKPLFDSGHPLLVKPLEVPVLDIVLHRDPHDEESVKEQTPFKHYNRWKEITIEKFGIKKLIDKKE